MEMRPSFGRRIVALEHPLSIYHSCLLRASTVSCADAGEGSHFDGGLKSQNYARIFTVNEASGSSTLGGYILATPVSGARRRLCGSLGAPNGPPRARYRPTRPTAPT